jgi:multicomponent K+:H+ antiporter subunit D
MGTLLAAVGLFTLRGISAALYYIVHSTIATAALFLLAEVIASERGEARSRLEPAPDLLQPMAIGGLFLAAGIAVVGLPPLSGFVGKLLILDGALGTPALPWLWAVVLVTSLLAVIAIARAGSVVFWKTLAGERGSGVIRAPAGSLALVSLLLVLTAAMALLAGPFTAYTDATAEQLMSRDGYIRSVLGPEAVLALNPGGP